MPTLKTLRLNEDQQQPVQPVTVDKIITRFPYKEFGMAQNGKNGSLTVTLPNGMKIHMLAPAIKYYTEIMGDGRTARTSTYRPCSS